MKKLSASGNDRLEINESAEISIEDNSAVSVIIRPTKSCKVELMIGSNCVVESYVFQEKEANVVQINHVGGDSIMRSCSLWLSKGSGKIENILDGARSQAYDLHIFVEGDSQALHLDAELRHLGKKTKGDIIVRGIVKDSAIAKLDGMIRVAEGGAGAESKLTENVMLLDSGAHAEANPELEILNNDVQSTHAATVSQIDQDKIFYLMSRGLSRESARRMIVEGFLESGAENMGNESFRKMFIERAVSALENP
jgi:Fe-S cluster assembly scaffold protein SufB